VPRSRFLLTVLIAAALWVLLAFATYYGWIHGTNHRDFYPRWAGARLALFEGRDLYADDTTLRMQVMLYGQAIPPGEDPQAFAYPAILVPLLLPFWWIENVEIATAAWEATSILLLLGALLFTRSIWGNTPRWVIVLLLLWYYPILMIFQAQITALPLAAMAVSLWAYTRQRDCLAGALLPIGFIKPEQVIVPVILLLIIAVREQRWRVMGGATLAGAALLLASIAVNGWWIPRWLAAVERYAVYAQTSWSPATAWAISPFVALALAGSLVWLMRLAHWNSVSAIAAGIPLGIVLLPQTLIWGLTLLILPLSLAWRSGVRLMIALIWLIGWLMVLLTGEGWRLQTLILPMLTLAAVAYASRR
jgi:hypothetical protein